ncbi:MAG TPA: efflux RND transporter periplasmic adaptor subunit [Clostridiales bacterium]|nr:efflux RND transporter periplasmic adaptor subunit [Clostridiales bacterium]
MDIRTIEENMNLLKQKRIRKAIIVFFLFMLIMTFLSKTLSNLSLPRVNAVKPSAGYLVREIRGDGVIEPVEAYEIYPDKNVKVKEILVKSGSYVSKGEKIAETDITEAEELYAKSMLRYENAKLDYQKLLLSKNGLPELEKEIERIEGEIGEKQAELEDIRQLYSVGAQSADDVSAAEKSLKNARDDLAQKRQEYEKRREQYEIDIRKAQNELKIMEMELEDMKVEEGIYAPADGIIKTVNDKRDVEKGAPVCVLVDPSKGFRLRIPASKTKTGYLSIGEMLKVDIRNADIQVDGTIADIRDNVTDPANKKDLIIVIESDSLSGGETGSVRFAKKSGVYSLLVPNSAIHEDSEGTYVFVVDEKQGFLGNENYVRKAYVEIEDYDDSKTAVSSGITIDSLVMTGSSKPVFNGDVVRLAVTR